MYFANREQAGTLLAERLFEDLRGTDQLVIALPRGGVPVAFPIAQRLQVPLEILIVRKLSSIHNPEYALGAVTEKGHVWVNREDYRVDLDQDLPAATEEMKRQGLLFRRGEQPLNVKGRKVILVDDGIATGSTLMAAIASLKALKVQEITVAVPVASKEAIALIKNEVDHLYVGYEPDVLWTVGEWYRDFAQVTDAEVIELLNPSKTRHQTAPDYQKSA